MAIDIMSAFENKPPQLDFIWPGFLAGTVGALIAPGATGKSYWALEAVMSIACSVTCGDLLKIGPGQTGRVVYLAGEDPESVLIGRVHAIGSHFNAQARMEIAKNLMLEPIMGRCFNVMRTKDSEWLIQLAMGARLIVLDTLSRTHCLDENSNGDMSRLISTLESIAVKTGAAVLYLHHVSKGSVREGQADLQQAARGAGALVDNVRWCGFVSKMSATEAKMLSDRAYDRQPIGDRKGFFVRYGVSKQNYALVEADKWYQRGEGGVLLPVDLAVSKSVDTGNKVPAFKVRETDEAEW